MKIKWKREESSVTMCLWIMMMMIVMNMMLMIIYIPHNQSQEERERDTQIFSRLHLREREKINEREITHEINQKLKDEEKNERNENLQKVESINIRKGNNEKDHWLNHLYLALKDEIMLTRNVQSKEHLWKEIEKDSNFYQEKGEVMVYLGWVAYWVRLAS